jgi:hypothetical protein
VNWVLDLDIKGFFDGLSHEWLVKFVEHRIADRRVVRLIQKWRRSQNGRVLWDRMLRLLNRWLPLPSVCHPSPLRRMGVVT